MPAYLFSRYPVISQTFCDTELLALRAAGVRAEIFAIHEPKSAVRHGYVEALLPGVEYAPSAGVLRELEEAARREGRWPGALVDEHERRFGAEAKAALRARNALWLASRLPERGLRHCHIHFANRAAHTALFLKALAGISYSLTVHGQDFMVDLGDDALLDAICAEASFVVAVSDFSRDLLLRRAPAAEGKVHRIYNGLDLARWRARGAPPPRGDALKVVSVGRLLELKGFDDVIVAVAALEGEGIGVEFEIIGEGEDRERLEGLIRDRGLAGRVTIAGEMPQEDVARRLAAADLFVLASKVAGSGAQDVLPTVVLEAMAAGVPVVATRLGGIPEMIADGRTGLLVEPGDVAGLTAAMRRVAREPAVAAAWAAAAREVAEARFSADVAAEEMARLFARVAEDGEVQPRTPGLPRAAALVASGLIEGETAAFEARGWPVYVAREAEGSGSARARSLPPDVVLAMRWPDPAAAADSLRPMVVAAGAEGVVWARRALWLAEAAAADGWAHLHVYGEGALPWAAWISGLGRWSVSATVVKAVPGGCLAPLPRRLTGGRAEGTAAAGAWGRGFVARAEVPADAWMRQLEAWAARSPLGRRFWDEVGGVNRRTPPRAAASA